MASLHLCHLGSTQISPGSSWKLGGGGSPHPCSSPGPAPVPVPPLLVLVVAGWEVAPLAASNAMSPPAGQCCLHCPMQIPTQHCAGPSSTLEIFPRGLLIGRGPLAGAPWAPVLICPWSPGCSLPNWGGGGEGRLGAGLKSPLQH